MSDALKITSSHLARVAIVYRMRLMTPLPRPSRGFFFGRCGRTGQVVAV